MFCPTKQPKGNRLFSFVVIADTHVNESDDFSSSPFQTNVQANDRARYAFADIASLAPPPHFIVHLGDIVHPLPRLPAFEEAARRYKEISKLVPMPVHLVPGNHDVGDKNIDWMPADIVCDAYLAKYRRTFGADYFALDVGPLRLLIVNTLLFNSGLASETKQMEWIDAQLEAADKRVFVFIHYPPYLLDEGEESTYDNMDQPGRGWLVERLKHRSVEAVFAGHVHNFWYDAVGQAEMYILPSTAFLRHDFTEMYRVDAGAEYGRADTEKFGYFIVDIFEQGHVARLVRTHGATVTEGSTLPKTNRIAPVHTKTSKLRRFGVELRHPWAEIVQIPATGGTQEFGRKPARNDYQLMALWEMGVRTLKIPTQDLEDEPTLRRAQLMTDVGHDFILTSLGVPRSSTVENISRSQLNISAIEVNLSLAKAAEQAASLSALRTRTGAPVLLAHLHTSADQHSDGKHFSHFVNAGLRLDELERHREVIAQLLKEEAIDGVTIRLDWGTDVVAAGKELEAFASEQRCEVLASVKLGAHSLAVANYDDQAIASLAAQTVVISCCTARVRYIVDTFMDVDRGYFPRNGFIDRRFNPRLASNVVARLCAAFQSSGSVEIARIEQIGNGRAISFRLASSWFVLVCGCGSEVTQSIVEHSATHPYALNLATGDIHCQVPGTTQSDCFPVGGSVLALLMQHWGNG